MASDDPLHEVARAALAAVAGRTVTRDTALSVAMVLRVVWPRLDQANWTALLGVVDRQRDPGVVDALLRVSFGRPIPAWVLSHLCDRAGAARASGDARMADAIERAIGRTRRQNEQN